MNWKDIADQAMKDISEMRAELNKQDREIERLQDALREISEYDSKCTDNEDFCNYVLSTARNALGESK